VKDFQYLQRKNTVHGLILINSSAGYRQLTTRILFSFYKLVKAGALERSGKYLAPVKMYTSAEA